MDRAPFAYLVIGVNVALLVFVTVLLIVAVLEDQDATPGENPAGTPDEPGVGTASVEPAEGPSVPAEPPQVPTAGQPTAAEPERNHPPDLPVLPEDTAEKVERTRRTLKELMLAVELAKSRHGEYPPSVLAGAGDEERNGGVESLLIHLDLDGLLSRLDMDDLTGNTDEDRFAEGYTLRGRDLGGRDRKEIVDAWGNPLIYFRNDRYATSDRYLIGGRAQTVTPRISALTGRYHAEKFVMIWSAGPDGRNENGTGDDVTSWHIRE